MATFHCEYLNISKEIKPIYFYCQDILLTLIIYLFHSSAISTALQDMIAFIMTQPLWRNEDPGTHFTSCASQVLIDTWVQITKHIRLLAEIFPSGTTTARAEVESARPVTIVVTT